MDTLKSKTLFQLLGPRQILAVTTQKIFPAPGFHLLALISTSAGFRVSRAEAAQVLWPTVSDQTARANLRQLLVRMNRAVVLDPPLITSVGNHIVIGHSDYVDVMTIQDLLKSQQPEDCLTAIDLYVGPLLALPAASIGDDPAWLVDARYRFCKQVADAARQVLEQITRFGAGSANDIERIQCKLEHLEFGDPMLSVAVASAFGRIGSYDRAKSILAGAEARAPSKEGALLLRRLSAIGTNNPERYCADSPQPVAMVPRLALLRPKAGLHSKAVTLAESLVEELAFGLAAYHSFAVLAPYSTFAMADDFGLPRDNSQLRADYAVSGILDHDGAEVSLRLRLTHLSSRSIVWASAVPIDAISLGRSLRQVMSRVVMTIAAELEHDLRNALRLSSEPSALLHYLQGRTLQARCDLPHVRRARSEFSQALAVDGRFAPAQARIAETLFVEWILRGGTDTDLLSAARLRAERAVQLEPGGSTGHWVTGAVALYQRRWEVVEEAFAQAESLAPHDADMLLEFGDALSHLGQHDAAERRFAAALDLNPMPPDRYWWFGASIAFNRFDFATAAQRCERIADKTVALGLRTASYAQSGQYDLARTWARRLKETLPGMTAEALISLSPDRDGKDIHRAYVDGLRMAGVK